MKMWTKMLAGAALALIVSCGGPDESATAEPVDETENALASASVKRINAAFKNALACDDRWECDRQKMLINDELTAIFSIARADTKVEQDEVDAIVSGFSGALSKQRVSGETQALYRLDFESVYVKSMSPLVQAISDAPFADGKLRVLRTAVEQRKFLSKQVGEIMGLFNFDDERIAAVKLMNARIVDRENSFTLYEHLTFDSSKAKLGDILNNPSTCL